MGGFCILYSIPLSTRFLGAYFDPTIASVSELHVVSAIQRFEKAAWGLVGVPLPSPRFPFLRYPTALAGIPQYPFTCEGTLSYFQTRPTEAHGRHRVRPHFEAAGMVLARGNENGDLHRCSRGRGDHIPT